MQSQLRIQWGKTKAYEFYGSNGLRLTSEAFESLNCNELIYASPAHRAFAILNYLDDYQLLRELGRGGFGTVYETKHKYTGEYRAIKIVKGSQLASARDFSRLFQEIKVLCSLNHKGIVKLYGGFSYHTRIGIVMEYIKGESLKDWINTISPSKSISEITAKEIMKQLINIVSYCHDEVYVHRDLKLDNIMVLEESKETDIKIKLIDFGIARMYNEVSKSGTLIYSPPEIVDESHLETDPAIDVWALGVILYRLLLGRFPFEGATPEITKNQILNRNIFQDPHSHISRQCWDFINLLLQKDRNKRIKVSDMMGHSWFQYKEIIIEEPKLIVEENKNVDETKDSAERIREVLKNYIKIKNNTKLHISSTNKMSPNRIRNKSTAHLKTNHGRYFSIKDPIILNHEKITLNMFVDHRKNNLDHLIFHSRKTSSRYNSNKIQNTYTRNYILPPLQCNNKKLKRGNKSFVSIKKKF